MKKTQKVLSAVIGALMIVNAFSISEASVSAVVTASEFVNAAAPEQVGAVSAVRQRIVNYMTSMATVKWTCSNDFVTGTTRNGVWELHDKYFANQTYYGIPYDQEWGTNGLIDLGKFNRILADQTTISGRIGRNDCSYAVCQSIRQVDGALDINSSSTAHLYPGSNDFVKVGKYSFSSNKATTCSQNGNSVMVAAYKQLQPGDCVCNDGHAMLVVGNDGKTGITVVHQSSGPYYYDPKTKKSTNTYNYDRKPPRNSSWGINESVSYSQLFSKNYIPLTNKVVALSDATPTSAVDLGTNFYANIVVTSNTNLAVAANSSANVLLATKSNSNAQKWLFERASDKSYRITNVGTNKCLDVSGGKTDDGTNIGVYANNDKANQRWYFVKDGSGYTIVPKSSTSSAMDIKNGSIANGSDIWQYTRNQSAAQRFSVVKLLNKYNIAYNSNGGTGTMASGTIEEGATLTISNCAFSRSGCRFGGYNVLRSSDNRWYVAGEGWKTAGEINAGGFTKRPYLPGETYRFTDVWYSGVPAGTTFTFYPIWLPNAPKLRCFLNYSGCNYMLGSDLADGYQNYIKSRNTSIYTVARDDSEAVRLNNQSSLKITAVSDDTGASDVVWVTSANAGRNTGSNGYFPETGDSNSFTLNFWAKSTVKGTNMKFRWGFEAAVESVELDTAWKLYSVPMDKNINFDNWIHCAIDKKTTVWLNNITLTLGTNGAIRSYRHETECAPIEQAYSYGGNYDPLPQPEREGYTFLGWFTQQEGGTQITAETNVASYNVAVYAHWQKNNSDVPIVSVSRSGKLYELYDNNMTWEEAEAFCESKGGHLATVNSEEENELIGSMLADERCTAWLGAKLNTETKNWEWITGEALDYVNWAPGEPSGNPNGYYMQMISFDTGLQRSAGCWNDQPNGDGVRSLYCRENCLVICEYEPLIGDVDLDGTVSIDDATLLQHYLCMFDYCEDISDEIADTNQDGRTNIKDVTEIQRYLAEFSPGFGRIGSNNR